MSGKRGRIFIPQEPMRRNSDGQLESLFDLTPAAAYGQPVVMLSSNLSPLSSAPVIHELRRHLKDFSDNDYVLAVGAPSFIGWTVAIAADNNRGFVKMLVYDRETRAYIEIEARLWGKRPTSVDPQEKER